MSALTSFVLVAERPRPKPGSDARDLAEVATEMNGLYGDADLAAPFRATSEDCIEGAVAPDADPLPAILLATLEGGPGMRWSIVSEAEIRVDGIARRDRAFVRIGYEAEDRLLEDLLPLLFDQLDDLTDRQRTVARLALVDGLRQTQVAASLDVRRATVSISFERSHIASLSRFVSAVRRVMLKRGGESGPLSDRAAD